LTIIKITCDFREKNSGIPKLLADKKVNISFSSLTAGDYIINDQILVERKTAEDFIQSIMDNRLFEQCSKLKKDLRRVLILIEGNPYKTEHKIDGSAVKGAILSILTAWQIPVIYSQSVENSVELMMMIGTQSLKGNVHIRMYKGYKTKKIKSQRLRFLQGIPSIGPAIAARLIDHFGTIKSIVNTSADELRKIKGIGKKNAKKIVEFFNE
jgi:Fanconi anemia group M protein